MAAAIDVDLAPFSKATYLVNLGRYQQASEHWHQTSIAILGSEAKLGRKRMWQYAGLSEALAAIAADKENDAVAYQYWADSMRFLMMGGTNWTQMRRKLHQRYERANTQLSTQLQITDVASSIDEEWQKELSTLQVWEEKLALFSFTSPKLGLEEKYPQPDISVITPSVPKSYYQPSGGNKKLTGMKAQFRKDTQFVPITSEQDELNSPEPIPVSNSNVGESLQELPEQNVKSDGSKLVIPRPLKSEASNQQAAITPLLNKTIRISGPLEEVKPGKKPEKNKQSYSEGTYNVNTGVGEQNNDSDEVVTYSVEPYQFIEQQGKENSNKVVANPLARGSELLSSDKKGVEAIQRRSLVLDSTAPNSSEP
ncbi:hypothetical protein [Photobacterium kasasachensis]|uniref:hypothetical protein n=1 Tax=Photobacterium kasasachensis TaxID=2910240 RepID=UPI003D0E2D62